MIPDKIYVREYPDGIARFWEEKKKEDVVATIPHEYIRKDALLKWVKDNLLECEASDDDADYGRIDAYKKLIDKLNSM